MTENWNAALGRARGRLILKLDGDDRMTPGALGRLAGALDTQHQAGVAACLTRDCDVALRGGTLYGARAFSQAGIDPRVDQLLSPESMFPHLFDDSQPWHSCALMFRREALDALDGWDTRWGCASDTDIILRLFLAGFHLAHVGFDGIQYRRRAGSVSDRFRQDDRLLWESTLIHLIAADRWSRDGHPVTRPLRIAWYRHWRRMQELRKAPGKPPERYLETINLVRPPPGSIRFVEWMRLQAHRLLRGS